MIYIAVPDMNDSISTISIDGKEYGLRFTYNERFDFWSFSIYEEDTSPIISMVKIVPNFPLFHFYTESNLPDGIFGCISSEKAVRRNSFKDKEAEFVFIPRVELED